VTRTVAHAWVPLALACACSPEPALSGVIDLRTRAARRAVLLTAKPPPRASGDCETVVGMLPQIRERLAEAPPKDSVLDTVDRCLADLGRGPELVSLYRLASAAQPTLAGYRYRLASAFVTLGDVDEALRHLDAALALVDRHPRTLFLKGLLLASRADDDPEARRGARDAWRALLKVAPEHEGFGGIGPEEIRRSVAAWTKHLDRPTKKR